MLDGRNLSFGYGRRTVIRSLSLGVAPGEIVGLGGPSGCGKTTLGRLLAGRLRPAAGAVLADGRPLPAAGFRPVQLLSQTPLFAMNPRWRIAAVLAEAGRPDADLRRRLGVDPAWDSRYPHELSGGQLQRVSILRALAPGVRYLVADEITAPLDPVAQAELWSVLAPLAKGRGIGILAISHDRPLLERVADRALSLVAEPDAPPG